MSPCVDAVLLEVAAPEQIAALSHWSHDPRAASAPVAVARRFPVHMGTTEELVRLKPDLLFVSPWLPAASRGALERMGVPMVVVGVPATPAAALAQVRTIAAAAGQPARGAALAGEIERALQAARRQPARPALLRMASGFVPGPGSLSEALMANAGLQSLSAGYGLTGAGNVPLEPLLLKPPPLLLTDRPEAVAPLLRARTRLAALDRRLLNCGGPSIIAASARLAAIRDSLP
jgi:iron complex transport system substrate-binding protein